jgi:hypothetical protein
MHWLAGHPVLNTALAEEHWSSVYVAEYTKPVEEYHVEEEDNVVASERTCWWASGTMLVGSNPAVFAVV